MGWTADLLVGIAEHLAANAGATWKPSGAYVTSDVRPIIITAVPASPDVVIVLTPYGVTDDPALNDTVQGVQVRTRGTKDPRVVTALDDDVFDALHGLSGVVLNGVHVIQMYRQSAAPLGVDGNGRHEATANYYVQTARPSTHRTT